ncbi:NlpC/P60 family protein [Demequina iriomotensis]|uniref:NlpC/P60 family protein n=1 Tax=Demequina iriomotensis TaxID=1536641 RepID=UPI0012E0BD78|nr:NlpC/P60 family protein [Demequina iriomotensis]
MTAGLKRVLALAAMFAIASAVVVAAPHRARADEYPGQAEIDAARAAANDVASGIDELDGAIAQLAAARDEAETNALVAGADYMDAQEASDAADDTLVAAEARAEQAEKDLAEARANLASVAQAAYRDAGSMSQIGAVVGAETVDDVIARSEAFTRGSDEADMWVQRVKAAELVASTMHEYADEAATEAQAAATEAKSAYAEAQDAQAYAERAVEQANATRADAVVRLAELRGVTVQLEEERQAGLEAARAAQAQAEAQERLEAAEQEEQEQSRPRPTATRTSEPEPDSTKTSTPKPTKTSEPDSTKTSEPEETKTSEPEPTKTSTPKPTSTPEPEKPATTWRSTAAQGVAAANAAIALSGKPYLLGGAGPTYYDCSGLTSTAWSSAGIYITRTSRSQYAATSHLAYSQLRPGDLVFWATNTSDPSTIYHVAMYVGGGMVMEASNPSRLSGTRGLYAWGSANLMPYIGRP